MCEVLLCYCTFKNWTVTEMYLLLIILQMRSRVFRRGCEPAGDAKLLHARKTFQLMFQIKNIIPNLEFYFFVLPLMLFSSCVKETLLCFGVGVHLHLNVGAGERLQRLKSIMSFCWLFHSELIRNLSRSLSASTPAELNLSNPVEFSL